MIDRLTRLETKTPGPTVIVGGGFGLYGWLPAVASLSDEPIWTLRRYRETLMRRPELQSFLLRVTFVDHLRDAYAAAGTIVIARRPRDQPTVVAEAIDAGFRGRFILEKPVAVDPEQAQSLLRLIEDAGCHATVSFTLAETAWARELVHYWRRPSTTSVRLQWYFRAHHFIHDRQTWKRSPEQGGGVLRFYAIHLLPLLVDDPLLRVVNCRIDCEAEWIDATLRSDGRSVHISCDSNHDGPPLFRVSATDNEAHETIVFEDRDPFAGEPRQDVDEHQDARVEVLRQVLRRSMRQTEAIGSPERHHLRLWSDLERTAQL